MAAIILVLVLLSGCSQTSLPENNNNQLIQEEAEKEPEEVSKNEDIETTDSENQVENSEESSDPRSANLSIVYSYDNNYIVPKDAEVEINIKDVLFVNPGDLIGDGPRKLSKYAERETPKVSCNNETVALKQDDIDSFRKYFLNFYNDNLYDHQQEINDLYAEYAASLNSQEAFDNRFNYTDKINGDFVLYIDGDKIPIHGDKCRIYASNIMSRDGSEPFDVAINQFYDPERDCTSVLLGITLTYECEIENINALIDYFFNLAEKNKGINGIEPEEMVLNDMIYIEKGEPKEKPSSEPKDNKSEEEKTSEDTGIIGKWYPDYSAFSVYYIQINEGGAGEIHRDSETIPFTYSFDGEKVRINISTGGSNEFYYSDGKLVSDFDGTVYTK